MKEKLMQGGIYSFAETDILPHPRNSDASVVYADGDLSVLGSSVEGAESCTAGEVACVHCGGFMSMGSPLCL
jgi:hypothetical protein